MRPRSSPTRLSSGKGHDFVLLHTSGFRDILEIGREHRYNLTNLKLRFPEPVSKRSLRLAVEERVSAGGEVVQAPDREPLVAELRRIVEPQGIRSFAICFLHSYRNPANEELVRSWIEELYSRRLRVLLVGSRADAARIRALDDLYGQRLHDAAHRRLRRPPPEGAAHAGLFRQHPDDDLLGAADGFRALCPLPGARDRVRPCRRRARREGDRRAQPG